MSWSWKIVLSNGNRRIERFWNTEAGWAQVRFEDGTETRRLVETASTPLVAQSNLFDRAAKVTAAEFPNWLWELDVLLNIEQAMEKGARSGRLRDDWTWKAECIEVATRHDDMPIAWEMPSAARSRDLREKAREVREKNQMMRREIAWRVEGFLGLLKRWERDVIDDEIAQIRAERG